MVSNMDYLGAIRRNLAVVGIVLTTALIVTAVVTAMQMKVYSSSAQLIVAPALGPTSTDVIRSVEALDRRTVVATFARIPTAPNIQEAVAQQLKLAPGESASFVTHGSVVPSTNIIRIDVDGPDAKKTADMANLIAMTTAREAEALYRVYTLRMLSQATAPASPSRPDKARNWLVGVAIGLFLGIAAALVIERLRIQGIIRSL